MIGCMGATANRVGAAILGVIGIGLFVAGVWADWPRWALALTVALTVVGFVLSVLPGSKATTEPRRETAFVRGNVNRSSMVDVSSQAETFIDGSLSDSEMSRVEHSPPPRRSWRDRLRRQGG